MNDTHVPTERFPEVQQGRSPWSAEEATHLAGCPACRLEWSITAAAPGLGRGVADGLDAERIAAGVRRKLAETAPIPRRVSRPVWWFVGLAAAAALLLLSIPGIQPAPSPAAAPSVTVLHELDGLTAAELETVLDAMPPAAGAASHVDLLPLDDLDTGALERVLQSME
jgi:hypothetical protein